MFEHPDLRHAVVHDLLAERRRLADRLGTAEGPPTRRRIDLVDRLLRRHRPALAAPPCGGVVAPPPARG